MLCMLCVWWDEIVDEMDLKLGGCVKGVLFGIDLFLRLLYVINFIVGSVYKYIVKI